MTVKIRIISEDDCPLCGGELEWVEVLDQTPPEDYFECVECDAKFDGWLDQILD